MTKNNLPINKSITQKMIARGTVLHRCVIGDTTIYATHSIEKEEKEDGSIYVNCRGLHSVIIGKKKMKKLFNILLNIMIAISLLTVLAMARTLWFDEYDYINITERINKNENIR